MRPLVKHFDALSEDELRDLVRASIANSQVWSAGRCRAEYLPALIEANRHRIAPDDLRALEYQVEHDEAYVPDEG